MKISKPDLYFGLEEFNQLKKTFKKKIRNNFPKFYNTEENSDNLNKQQHTNTNQKNNLSTEIPIESSENIIDETNKNKSTKEHSVQTDSVNLFKTILGTKGFLILGLILILSITITSLITIKLKIRKKQLSYKLSKQTALMKLLSQKKAVFELEYAYLKSNENIKEYAKKRKWIHIAPRDIIFISLDKNSILSKRKNKINIKNSNQEKSEILNFNNNNPKQILQQKQSIND